LRFLAMVAGINFEGVLDGESARVGFYANRHVEASSSEAVDQAALFELISRELKQSGIDPTPQSKIWVSRVSQVSAEDDRRFSGFSFYKQDSWLKRALSKLFH